MPHKKQKIKSMDLQGRIKLITAVQTFGNNGFQKREIVITTEEQYPQHVVFEFTQDKCALLDNYRIGQLVKISFNVRGREWINPQGEAKYFNSLQGWRIENMEVAQNQNMGMQTPPPIPPAPPADAFEPTNNYGNNDFDDLPF
ncbi:Domain of uncharacterised function (DUF3127) [Capnocytophaga canimorsus]|nr:uncharacterized protein DUF3127 [Capnocytophaga canimorsus]STA73185.1 Domain of uncharacterised function (DUF3127) [Capnocytophaga canimorsus]VEJ20129.1 Domain of uncharacterised function (DUF3127) [Capnocytophaga canimorsus]